MDQREGHLHVKAQACSRARPVPCRDTDMRHWSKFPGFHELESQVSRSGGRAAGLATTPYVFMRWKEMNFVNTSEACGLTIAGFYFGACSRAALSLPSCLLCPSGAPPGARDIHARS